MGDSRIDVDAVIIGAGFAGMYMLHRLRDGEVAAAGYAGFALEGKQS